MLRAIKVLNILISSKPEFSNHDEENIWVKSIYDFCEVSGLLKYFDRLEEDYFIKLYLTENKV
jgi:hypothetical protein